MVKNKPASTDIRETLQDTTGHYKTLRSDREIVDDELLQVEIVRHRVERHDGNEHAPTFATLWPTGPRGI